MLFLKQYQSILRYGFQSASLTRKLLLTGFLAMHVRASRKDLYTHSGEVDWITNGGNGKVDKFFNQAHHRDSDLAWVADNQLPYGKRWIFLAKSKSGTVSLYRLEEPQISREKNDEETEELNIQNEVFWTTKRILLEKPISDHCKAVLNLEYGYCSGAHGKYPHLKKNCNNNVTDADEDPNHVNKEWRPAMKKMILHKGGVKGTLTNWYKQVVDCQDYHGKHGRCDLSLRLAQFGARHCLRFPDDKVAEWSKVFGECGMETQQIHVFKSGIEGYWHEEQYPKWECDAEECGTTYANFEKRDNLPKYYFPIECPSEKCPTPKGWCTWTLPEDYEEDRDDVRSNVDECYDAHGEYCWQSAIFIPEPEEGRRRLLETTAKTPFERLVAEIAASSEK